MGEATYTKAQYARFVKSVENVESRNQLDRIAGRLDQRAIIKELGKEVCDAMFARLTGKPTPTPENSNG
jgi:hypothetical protein